MLSTFFTDLHAAVVIRRDVEVCRLSYYGGKDQPPPSPGLSEKEAARLFREYRRTGDPTVKEKLVTQYLCYAFKLASKAKGPRLSHDEAVSAANCGLVEAIDKFKPGRRVSFLVYSYMIIRRHLTEALVATYPVTISTHMRKKLRAGLVKQLGSDEPTTLKEAFQRLSERPDANLAQAHEREESSVCAPSESPTPGASLFDADEVRSAILTELTETQREVVQARFFQPNGEPESFEDIGARLGISKNSAREEYNLALVKLRRFLQK